MNSLFLRLVSSSAVGLALLVGSARADISVAVGTLAPGESVQVTYDVTINPGIESTLTGITHRATVTYDGGSAPSDDPETDLFGDETITPLADVIPPRIVSVARLVPAASPAVADVAVFRITFNEAVLNVDGTDFAVAGTTATVTGVAAGGVNAFDLTVSGGNIAEVQGAITLGFAAGQNICDLGNNALVDLVPTGANVNSVVLLNNDAPILTAYAPVLAGITEDDVGNPGQTVASIVGTSIADPDTGAAQGIAITGVVAGPGLWQFSTNSGGTWSSLGAVSGTGALLLRAVDKVRYLPDGIHAGSASFTYRAWDQTGATAGQQGTKVSAASSGGSNPFSSATDTAMIVIASAAPTSFADWAADAFTAAELADPAIGGVNADPDGAGITNLMRYALDLPARGPVAVETLVSLDVAAGAASLTLRFPVRAVADGLSYEVQSSQDLVTWTTEATFTANGTKRQISQLVAVPAGAKRFFLRLRVR